jgi:hypothetical protein
MTVLIIGRGPQVVASVVQALHDHAIESVGVTDDVDATARLEAGSATALVIGGGVDRRSRRALRRAAQAAGVTVIQGALGNRDVRGYVRDELVPLLRQS